MVANPAAIRKALRPVVALFALLALIACDTAVLPTNGTGTPSRGGPPVQVAMLLPQSDPGAAPVARSLENAARLAMSERPGQRIDLRVYDTAGDPQTAAARAREAVDAGAQIILGPLFGEAANAVGLAVANDGVNVLSFSNNASIAGGNVFILGQTFDNTAERLMSFAAAQGQQAMVVIHSQDVPGQAGRLAIERAAARNGVPVIASEGYPLSIEGVSATAQRANASAQAGADTVFLTTEATNAAMPMLLQMLPENGLPQGEIQYIGLTRWDVRPDLFALPGAEGAWFAQPDPASATRFDTAYRAAVGSGPHPLAGLAYDGITAIATLATDRAGFDRDALLRSRGFDGAGGRFQFLPDGSNRRALAVATIRDRQVTILAPAPASLSGAGS